MGFAVRMLSLDTPCMEREWRESGGKVEEEWREGGGRTETPAAKPEYLSLWQLASIMAVASIPTVVGQSTFHPVIVLFLPHFFNRAAPRFH